MGFPFAVKISAVTPISDAASVMLLLRSKRRYDRMIMAAEQDHISFSTVVKYFDRDVFLCISTSKKRKHP